ncbi:MAG: hypothetical protein NPIRA05_21670 [Nitrospirales bacterium]|nr:MAG: hypothetical protein NPIRA05_21670 [Nitrospirales bacterium]
MDDWAKIPSHYRVKSDKFIARTVKIAVKGTFGNKKFDPVRKALLPSHVKLAVKEAIQADMKRSKDSDQKDGSSVTFVFGDRQRVKLVRADITTQLSQFVKRSNYGNFHFNSFSLKILRKCTFE